MCAGAKIEPVTSMVAAVDSHCVMCAVPVRAGERCNPVTRATFGDSFNNKFDLRAARGRYVCGHCLGLWTKELLQRFGKSYATADGVFKLAADADVAAFLLQPPEPPFIAVVSTAKTQHLVWRAPVNYSRETIMVRFGDAVLTIRRRVLEQAVIDWRRLREIMVEGNMKGVAPIRLERMLESKNVGEIRADVAEAAKLAGDHAAMERLSRLSMGEFWGLNVARNYVGTTIPAPVRIA
jgi:CRISPR type IV-associated protein Csf1